VFGWLSGLRQTCFPDPENGCDADPSWYPAYAGTPPENLADNIATRRLSFTATRWAGFDAVRSIVAEMASRQF
jgi:hypothetical protein